MRNTYEELLNLQKTIPYFLIQSAIHFTLEKIGGFSSEKQITNLFNISIESIISLFIVVQVHMI